MFRIADTNTLPSTSSSSRLRRTTNPVHDNVLPLQIAHESTLPPLKTTSSSPKVASAIKEILPTYLLPLSPKESMRLKMILTDTYKVVDKKQTCFSFQVIPLELLAYIWRELPRSTSLFEFAHEVYLEGSAALSLFHPQQRFNDIDLVHKTIVTIYETQCKGGIEKECDWLMRYYFGTMRNKLEEIVHSHWCSKYAGKEIWEHFIYDCHRSATAVTSMDAPPDNRLSFCQLGRKLGIKNTLAFRIIDKEGHEHFVEPLRTVSAAKREDLTIPLTEIVEKLSQAQDIKKAACEISMNGLFARSQQIPISEVLKQLKTGRLETDNPNPTLFLRFMNKMTWSNMTAKKSLMQNLAKMYVEANPNAQEKIFKYLKDRPLLPVVFFLINLIALEHHSLTPFAIQELMHRLIPDQSIDPALFLGWLSKLLFENEKSHDVETIALRAGRHCYHLFVQKQSLASSQPPEWVETIRAKLKLPPLEQRGALAIDSPSPPPPSPLAAQQQETITLTSALAKMSWKGNLALSYPAMQLLLDELDEDEFSTFLDGHTEIQKAIFLLNLSALCKNERETTITKHLFNKYFKDLPIHWLWLFALSEVKTRDDRTLRLFDGGSILFLPPRDEFQMLMRGFKEPPPEKIFGIDSFIILKKASKELQFHYSIHEKRLLQHTLLFFKQELFDGESFLKLTENSVYANEGIDDGVSTANWNDKASLLLWIETAKLAHDPLYNQHIVKALFRLHEIGVEAKDLMPSLVAIWNSVYDYDPTFEKKVLPGFEELLPLLEKQLPLKDFILALLPEYADLAFTLWKQFSQDESLRIPILCALGTNGSQSELQLPPKTADEERLRVLLSALIRLPKYVEAVLQLLTKKLDLKIIQTAPFQELLKRALTLQIPQRRALLAGVSKYLQDSAFLESAYLEKLEKTTDDLAGLIWEAKKFVSVEKLSPFIGALDKRCALALLRKGDAFLQPLLLKALAEKRSVFLWPEIANLTSPVKTKLLMMSLQGINKENLRPFVDSLGKEAELSKEPIKSEVEKLLSSLLEKKGKGVLPHFLKLRSLAKIDLFADEIVLWWCEDGEGIDARTIESCVSLKTAHPFIEKCKERKDEVLAIQQYKNFIQTMSTEDAKAVTELLLRAEEDGKWQIEVFEEAVKLKQQRPTYLVQFCLSKIARLSGKEQEKWIHAYTSHETLWYTQLDYSFDLSLNIFQKISSPQWPYPFPSNFVIGFWPVLAFLLSQRSDFATLYFDLWSSLVCKQEDAKRSYWHTLFLSQPLMMNKDKIQSCMSMRILGKISHSFVNEKADSDLPSLLSTLQAAYSRLIKGPQDFVFLATHQTDALCEYLALLIRVPAAFNTINVVFTIAESFIACLENEPIKFKILHRLLDEACLKGSSAIARQERKTTLPSTCENAIFFQTDEGMKQLVGFSRAIYEMLSEKDESFIRFATQHQESLLLYVEFMSANSFSLCTLDYPLQIIQKMSGKHVAFSVKLAAMQRFYETLYRVFPPNAKSLSPDELQMLEDNLIHPSALTSITDKEMRIYCEKVLLLHFKLAIISDPQLAPSFVRWFAKESCTHHAPIMQQFIENCIDVASPFSSLEPSVVVLHALYRAKKVYTAKLLKDDVVYLTVDFTAITESTFNKIVSAYSDFLSALTLFQNEIFKNILHKQSQWPQTAWSKATLLGEAFEKSLPIDIPSFQMLSSLSNGFRIEVDRNVDNLVNAYYCVLSFYKAVVGMTCPCFYRFMRLDHQLRLDTSLRNGISADHVNEWGKATLTGLLLCEEWIKRDSIS